MVEKYTSNDIFKGSPDFLLSPFDNARTKELIIYSNSENINIFLVNILAGGLGEGILVCQMCGISMLHVSRWKGISAHRCVDKMRVVKAFHELQSIVQMGNVISSYL